MGGRRQEILDAALAIADRDGLDKVSMRTVAEDVGVTPMALYRHFDSKLALLDGMLERLVTSLEPEKVTGTWDERLTTLAYAYRDWAVEHPGRYATTLRAPDDADPLDVAASSRALPSQHQGQTTSYQTSSFTRVPRLVRLMLAVVQALRCRRRARPSGLQALRPADRKRAEPQALERHR